MTLPDRLTVEDCQRAIKALNIPKEFEQKNITAKPYLDLIEVMRENEKMNKLLNWVYADYSRLNLSFADNWYAETEEFWADRFHKLHPSKHTET